jgi:hypothetical protein
VESRSPELASSEEQMVSEDTLNEAVFLRNLHVVSVLAAIPVE